MTNIVSTAAEQTLQKSSAEFMLSYNKATPVGYPQLTDALLKKFKSERPQLFKIGELWSMDKHRKEVIDWFQILQNNRY